MCYHIKCPGPNRDRLLSVVENSWLKNKFNKVEVHTEYLGIVNIVEEKFKENSTDRSPNISSQGKLRGDFAYDRKTKGAGFLITNRQEHYFCVEIAETQPHTERLERDMD